MQENVYGYDGASDSVKLEYSEFPGTEYYDNGLALVGLSHNHGLAPYGDFHPYYLYQYRPETNEYQLIAGVDAWERESYETDFDGNPYPGDVDVDGDGIVYFIMPGESYVTDHPVSKKDYEEWYNSVLGGASRLDVPFQYLTPGNIQGLT